MDTGRDVSRVRIAPVRPGDMGVLLTLLRELAEYEKLAHAVTANEDTMRESLFAERPAAEVLLAWAGEEAIGYAVYFHNFSTFQGRPGLYLEDLYVRPAWRGAGVGKRLLARVARVAAERRCVRMEWMVLDWNVDAITFYRSLGADPLSDWTTMRLQGEPLARLAGLDQVNEDEGEPGR